MGIFTTLSLFMLIYDRRTISKSMNTDNETAVNHQQADMRASDQVAWLIESRQNRIIKRLDELEKRFNEKFPQTTPTPTNIFDSWVDFHSWDDIEAVIEELKQRGHNNLLSGPTTTAFPVPSDGWILIQSHNFLDKEAFKDKTWADYKNGFGETKNEFWLGLERVHQLTKNRHWILKIEIVYDVVTFARKPFPAPAYPHPGSFLKKHRSGQIGTSIWDNFSLGSEDENYRFNVGNSVYEDNLAKNAGDMLRVINGKGFSTKDRFQPVVPKERVARLKLGAVGGFRTKYFTGAWGSAGTFFAAIARGRKY